MHTAIRKLYSFIAGTLIGILSGLIGLGGAEFRLPILVGVFKIPTLEAIILNKAMSLIVVTTALIFRSWEIPLAQQFAYYPITLNLLAGSLIGAWWAAGQVMRLSLHFLNLIIMILLASLALVMLSIAWFDLHNIAALFTIGPFQVMVGLFAGLGIGIVAAVLGVAGGELLIPAIILIYGVDIKLAGSLSLTVSLPTMLVGFIRYSHSNAFKVLQTEQHLFRWMVLGSILGSAIGGLLVGAIPTKLLMTLLGLILLISAVKTFQHTH